MVERTGDTEETGPITRRQFLAAGAAGVGAGGFGTVLLGDPPETKGQGTTPESITDTAPGLPESDLPYPTWQYHHNTDGNRDDLAPASPINVVFPLEDANFEDVTATMVDAGWTETPLEYTLWAWNRETGQWERPDWSVAEAPLGLGGRLHARGWRVEGTLSLQAHVDSPPTPSHVVTSYADARAAVVATFEQAGWSVGGSIDLENQMPPDHDGLASVIRR